MINVKWQNSNFIGTKVADRMKMNCRNKFVKTHYTFRIVLVHMGQYRSLCRAVCPWEKLGLFALKFNQCQISLTTTDRTFAILVTKCCSLLLQISTVDEVNLCDLTYPGLGDIKYELSSFQWIYGRTPKFTVSHNITSGEILTIEVEKGHIKTISVQNENKTSDITGTLAGLPFCPVTIPSIIKQNKLTVQADNLYCNDILDLFEKIKFGA